MAEKIPLTAPETRFSNRVGNYVKYRPGYPPEVVALLTRVAGLGPAATVADIGSGTGIFTRLLLETAGRVFAVEPNAAMRAAAEAAGAGIPGFFSVDGQAQDTGLPDASVDLITAAQAFHWFNTPETRAEFSRILKPEGKIALIWNERRVDTTPFLRDYEALLREFATDYATVRHELVDQESLGRFFRQSFLRFEFVNEQRFDLESLKGRLLSSSYAPAEGQPGHLPMMKRLEDIFQEHQMGGSVSMAYDTRVSVGW